MGEDILLLDFVNISSANYFFSDFYVRLNVTSEGGNEKLYFEQRAVKSGRENIFKSVIADGYFCEITHEEEEELMKK